MLSLKYIHTNEQYIRPFKRHNLHHLLQTFIASNTADYQNFIAIAMRHCTLSYFDQHRKHRFLKYHMKRFLRITLVTQTAPVPVSAVANCLTKRRNYHRHETLCDFNFDNTPLSKIVPHSALYFLYKLINMVLLQSLKRPTFDSFHGTHRCFKLFITLLILQ